MKRYAKNAQKFPKHYPAQPDFKKQTPTPLIFREMPDRSYEKAFLSPETENDCEYCRNTAAWD